MITAAQALLAIPQGLREPLILEYKNIIQNYLEHRWLPSELSGGRFSEIVFTILEGYAKNAYAPAPAKPRNFVEACRKLEGNTQPHLPRSFKVLIPRILPALYEIRNNRNVGHVGGDVDPNHMDSMAVLSLCNWTMAELVRVFHQTTVDEAQKIVDMLADVRVPIIWSDGNVKRVLRPELKLHEQLLLLAAASSAGITSKDLLAWVEYKNTKYVMRTLRDLHSKRFLEFTEDTGNVRILPPGTQFVMELVRNKGLSNIV